MKKLSQKYTLVQLIEKRADGFEFGADEWPLHVTLADVFAVNCDSTRLLPALREGVSIPQAITSKVIGDEWFGPEKTVHVKLLERTVTLQNLHEQVVAVLASFNATFNNPEFAVEGFKPHYTVRDNSSLKAGNEVIFSALTLIDMFPNKDGFRRRVIASIPLVNNMPEQTS